MSFMRYENALKNHSHFCLQKLSQKILQPLLQLSNPKVTYAFTKHLWANGETQKAFDQLLEFTQRTLKTFQDRKDMKEKDEIDKIEVFKLLARCFIRLGEWQENLLGLSQDLIQSVLG